MCLSGTMAAGRASFSSDANQCAVQALYLALYALDPSSPFLPHKPHRQPLAMASIETKLTGALAGVGAGYLFLKPLVRLTQNVAEPPTIATTILGMMLQSLSSTPTCGERPSPLHVSDKQRPENSIISPSTLCAPLISAVQRQYKTLTFPRDQVCNQCVWHE